MPCVGYEAGSLIALWPSALTPSQRHYATESPTSRASMQRTTVPPDRRAFGAGNAAP